MFKLTKNLYTKNNTCTYEDEFANSVFIKRTESGFVSRLRFANENIKAKPIETKIPLDDDFEGADMHLDYRSDVDLESIDIASAIEDYTRLINYWIDLIYDMKILESHKGMDEAIYKQDLEKLSSYEEMTEVLKSLGM